jgi:hypothetical protein
MFHVSWHQSSLYPDRVDGKNSYALKNISGAEEAAAICVGLSNLT